MKIGSLFSGYGGLDHAAAEVFSGEVAWVSDIEPGPRKILAHRYPGVPNLGDITRVDWATVEPVDVITGGSPCQDLSQAGRRAGMRPGTRSGLWESMREAIATIRPEWVLWENVRGALSAEAHSDMEQRAGLLGMPDDGPSLRALGRVLGDLADLGYDAGWCGLRAADVGAPHGRFRVFVLAHARGESGDQWRPAGTREAAGGWPLGELGGRGLRTSSVVHLPTPRATDSHAASPGDKGGPNQRGSSGDLMLPRGVTHLLPTPSASVANDGEGVETWEARRQRVAQTAKNGNGFGTPLTIAVQLLPTPSVADSMGGHERRGGDRGGELLLKGIARYEQWGKYADAIARWEHLTRPAPAPTEPGPKGNPRLSARFAEWLMGLDDGWVTDVPGITRNEALKALGNGVVPQQAAAALAHMLASFYTTQLTERTSA